MKQLSLFSFLVLIVNLSFAQKKEKVQHLSALEFESQVLKVPNGSITILDVRTPGEFKQWHFEDAVLINYFGKGFKKKVNKLDKSKPIYVYCHSGIRSGLALGILKRKGFKPIYNMKGGTGALEAAHKKEKREKDKS